MRRTPSRSSAEIQTCFIMYPWQPSLPHGRKCEKKPSGAGEQRAEKTRRSYFTYTYIVKNMKKRIHFSCEIDQKPKSILVTKLICVPGTRMFFSIHTAHCTETPPPPQYVLCSDLLGRECGIVFSFCRRVPSVWSLV